MSANFTHHDIQELLGAFALDAVDDDERDVIEAHLAGCPRCRAEVAGHRETAALLAHSGERAPEGVWDRISTALDESPPALDLTRIVPQQETPEPAEQTDDLAERRMARAAPRSIPLRVAAATMAVAAAITLFLGVALGRNDSARLDRLEALAQDMEKAVVSNAAYAALNDSRNEQIRMASTDGTATAQLVRRPDGTGYLVPGTLAPLPAGRVYQLWAVRSDAKISLGVLGAVPEVSAFRMNGPVAAFAVTEEAAGGVSTTENQPVIVGYTKA
ncbi:MAG TPA: anti-sigma factor [Acidimicrobiia bacterium]|nr:anti-sigma factor [Acidimicrobiia bacterium]